MDTIIKILAFLIKAHQRIIGKLAIPQLLRRQTPTAKSKPTINKNKS
jgi:hypothetical protein